MRSKKEVFGDVIEGFFDGGSRGVGEWLGGLWGWVEGLGGGSGGIEGV